MKSAANKLLESKMHSYIYLKAEDFERRSNPSPIQVFSAAKQNLMSAIGREDRSKMLEELAAKYENAHQLMISFDENGDRHNIYEKAILNALSDELGFNIEDAYNIDVGLGEVRRASRSSSSEDSLKRIRKLRSGIRADGQKSQANVGPLKNKLNQVTELANKTKEKLSENKDLTISQIERARNDLEKLVKGIEDLINFLNSIPIQNDENNKNRVKELVEKLEIKYPKIFNESKGKKTSWSGISNRTSQQRIDADTANAIIAMLNSLIAKYALSLSSSVAGKLGEYMIHMVDLCGEDLGEKALTEALQKQIKEWGQHETQGQITLSGFSDSLAKSIKEELEASSRMTFGNDILGGHFTMTYDSQQKADAVITLEGNAIPISVKNYKGSKILDERGISLQSGSSLMTYLFGANNLNRNISSYYLNLLADHSDRSVMGNVRSYGYNTLILIMVYQSFSGKWLGKTSGTAEIFAWIDPKSGVHFYDIDMIIQKLAEPQNFAQLSHLVKINPNLASIKLKNDYVKAATGPVQKGKPSHQVVAIRKRVASAIADAHTKKISVAILPKALDLVKKRL